MKIVYCSGEINECKLVSIRSPDFIAFYILCTLCIILCIVLDYLGFLMWKRARKIKTP